jgi:hypothetical protein
MYTKVPISEILHITCCERITWRRDCTQAATRDFPKRKRDDDKPVVLYIPLTLSEHYRDCPPLSTSYESAEVALLHIMKTHDFNTSLLQ